jgi:hypothetical protein
MYPHPRLPQAAHVSPQRAVHRVKQAIRHFSLLFRWRPIKHLPAVALDEVVFGRQMDEGYKA